jgi:hypothetical protein
MSAIVRITTLVENTVNRPELLAEHGLSFHIQTGERQLLFDTGQSTLLLHNARKLGIGLENLDAIALSHGHYDHTGGLETVLLGSPRTRLFLHPEAPAPKFSQNPDGSVRSIGMQHSDGTPSYGYSPHRGGSLYWHGRCYAAMDGFSRTLWPLCGGNQHDVSTIANFRNPMHPAPPSIPFSTKTGVTPAR